MRGRRFVIVTAMVCLGAACGGDDVAVPESAATPTSLVEATEPTVAAESNSDDNDGAGVDDEPEADDVSGACGVAADADLWTELDAAVPGDVAEFVSQRTAALTAPNTETCSTMAPTDVVLDAATVGAAATASVVNEDPYVRYDLFVYESGDSADAAMARDLIRSELPALLPEASTVQVSKVGQTLFVARSYIDEGAGPSDEVQALLDYYSATIAGGE